MPDFQSKKRTPEKIENDPKATPPASSKMPKEDNPPFFVYLTRPQKMDYHNDRIELNIRKALYMFTDPRKPVIFLNLINELKVLQFNHENSHNPIAQIALKAKIDQLTSELQTFCTSNNVTIPPAAPVNDCPPTPPTGGHAAENNTGMDTTDNEHQDEDDDDVNAELFQALNQGFSLPSSENQVPQSKEAFECLTNHNSNPHLNIDLNSNSISKLNHIDDNQGRDGANMVEDNHGKGGKGGKGEKAKKLNRKAYTDKSGKEDNSEKPESYVTLEIRIAHQDMSRFNVVHPDIRKTPLSTLVPCEYVNPTCYPGKKWALECIYEVLAAHTRISLLSKGVSLSLKSTLKYDVPPWVFVLKYLRKEQNLTMALTEFLSDNEHLVGFRWNLPCKQGEHDVMFRMTTVEDPNQLTAGDRYVFHIKIPRIRFTIAQTNIHQMILDFDSRIGTEYGTPKIIEEPDENDPDSVFFSEDWVIRYGIIKIFDTEAMMFLETNSDTLTFSVLKTALGEKFDVRYSVPHYVLIAGIDDSALPPTPQYRKLEVTLQFPRTGEKQNQIFSGCKKGARTYHDPMESSKYLAADFSFVPKDDCPICNFPIDPDTLKIIYARTCPVPGCRHSYGNRREDEKAYLLGFDRHDCEEALHRLGHMKNYVKPELPKIDFDNKLTSEAMSKNVTESAEFAHWKTYIDRQQEQHASNSELRRAQKKSVVAQPVYIDPIKVKATPRQGFKRVKRP